MKYRRHNKIIEIISEQVIDTQEELIEKLREAGFDVTQATVSRDIRDLKIIKTLTEKNQYRYAISQNNENHISSRYRSIIKDTVTKVNCANNMVVLHTYSGMANAAAAAIDGMGWDEILGTIAGDDTIFVLMSDKDSAFDLVDKIKEIREEIPQKKRYNTKMI